MKTLAVIFSLALSAVAVAVVTDRMIKQDNPHLANIRFNGMH
jgi:hypothetical protein